MRFFVVYFTLTIVAIIIINENSAKEVEVEGRSNFVTRIIVKVFRSLIEYIRKVLNEGRLGIPSFNPLRIKNVIIDGSKLNIGIKLSGHFTAKTLEISGLTNWKTLKMNVAMLYFTVFEINNEFLISSVQGRGTYEAKIDTSFINTEGDGTVNFDAQDVIVKVKSTVKMRGLFKPYITKLSLKLTLAKSEITITGFNNSTELSKAISETVSDTAPIYLEKYPNWIDENYSEKLREYANKFLGW